MTSSIVSNRDWLIEHILPRDSVGLIYGNPELDNDLDLMGAHINQKRPLVYLALDLLLHIDHARVAPTKYLRQYKCYPADILFITEWFKSSDLKIRDSSSILTFLPASPRGRPMPWFIGSGERRHVPPASFLWVPLRSAWRAHQGPQVQCAPIVVGCISFIMV